MNIKKGDVKSLIYS